jgi:hypothetical protein
MEGNGIETRLKFNAFFGKDYNFLRLLPPIFPPSGQSL